MSISKSCFLMVSVLLALLVVGVSQAAFIVEAFPGDDTRPAGLANENFEGVGTASLRSYAAGTTAQRSLFSGTGAAGSTDTYVYSYTPGVDLDNTTFDPGEDLGNSRAATGMIGGETGFYNVYITWPPTTNVGSTCTITITNDADDVVVANVDMNTSGTGTPGGNNYWWLIAERVELTAGQTYTVTQQADGSAYVSIRSHGVMWEADEPILVPATLSKSEMQVEEGGPSESYTCVLDQQPTSDVFMTVRAHHDPNNLSLNGNDPNDPVVLVFTPDNWDEPRTITVQAVDDEIMEGPMEVLLRHSTDVDSGGDATYANGFAGYVKVTIIDNDGPDVGIEETDGSTDVIEGETGDEYYVRLLYPPTDKVTVKMSVASEGDPAITQLAINIGEGPVDEADLIFMPGDWDVPQAVTVTAVDDAELEYVHESTISFSTTSLDGGYDGLDVDDLVVTIEDNECGAWGFQAMDFDENCVVNLADFAQFAELWLACTQPYAEGCDDLR